MRLTKRLTEVYETSEALLQARSYMNRKYNVDIYLKSRYTFDTYPNSCTQHKANLLFIKMTPKIFIIRENYDCCVYILMKIPIRPHNFGNKIKNRTEIAICENQI